jgi:hypothetical protein
MTPEGKVKKSINKVLDKYKNDGIWYFMPVPSGYGKPTLDYIGFILGRGFAIEAKAPGKEPTERQELTIEDIRSSETKVFVIDGTDNTDTVDDLRAWITTVVVEYHETRHALYSDISHGNKPVRT